MDIPSINYISLFSGAGGLDLALRLAVPDARCICHVEIELPAAAFLAARMEDGSLDSCPIWSDIRTFDGTRWRGKVHGIVGGFPCQDLSVAGKREGIGGKRSGLWHEYERIIEEVQPDWCFIENVGGLVSSLTLLHRPEILEHFDRLRSASESAKDRWYIESHIERLHRRLLPTYGISALLYIRCCLGTLGYESEAGLFTAAEVRAPHKRERLFILAHRSRRGLRVLRESSKRAGLIGGGRAGVWRTPTMRDHHPSKPDNHDNAQIQLAHQAGQWKTPHGMGGMDASGKHGGSGGGEFAKQATQWTTPQAHDSGGGKTERVRRHGTKHGCANLADDVVKWQ